MIFKKLQNSQFTKYILLVYKFPFSKDSAQLQKWFDTISCSGGGDGAEDVQGAIELRNNLNWPSKFRIAILICDAPCHGHKYHKEITSDDYPGDEIRPEKHQRMLRTQIKDKTKSIMKIKILKQLEILMVQWKHFVKQVIVIRTEKPFAFGMMKDVFLMKKKQSGHMELYVIKTPIGSQPYKSLNDALTECRSHLICQKLMKKFREQLISKLEAKGIQRKLPPIKYSDFLILQESANSFWIAERFFNGEFVKYNNNYGFIESDINDLNKMAQAFSFYTYFVSDFNYMVSDVQGVETYFTDPAINTKDGKFDDTDMGLEGQQMYLVSYELMKDKLSKDLLEILDMYEQQIISDRLKANYISQYYDMQQQQLNYYQQ